MILIVNISYRIFYILFCQKYAFTCKSVPYRLPLTNRHRTLCLKKYFLIGLMVLLLMGSTRDKKQCKSTMIYKKKYSAVHDRNQRFWFYTIISIHRKCVGKWFRGIRWDCKSKFVLTSQLSSMMILVYLTEIKG